MRAAIARGAMTRRVAGCAVVMLGASAAAAQSVTLSPAPGASEQFDLRVINPTAAVIAPVAIPVGRDWPQANVSISASAPCQWTPGDASSSVLRTETLEANSEVSCTITVVRNSVPIASSSVWRFNPIAGSAVQVQPQFMRVGAFADTSLSLEQVAPFPRSGETTALFRLRAVSDANFSIHGAEIYNCAFNDEQYEPYSLQVDFPGGCEFARHTSGVGCPLSMADNHWILPEIPPHGEASCLIRLVAPGGIPSGILEDLGTESGISADGYLVFDESSGDRSVRLQVAFADVAIPLLGRQFTVLLGAMLLTIGALAHYRQKLRAVATSATEE